MIDYTINTKEQSRSGLRIQLQPGLHSKTAETVAAISVSEEAFGFLEPAVAMGSTSFARPFSHWGVTAVHRSEWLVIIEHWARLKVILDNAPSAEAIDNLRFITKQAKNDFLRNINKDCAKLSALITNLTIWLEDTLRNNEEISILGI